MGLYLCARISLDTVVTFMMQGDCWERARRVSTEMRARTRISPKSALTKRKGPWKGRRHMYAVIKTIRIDKLPFTDCTFCVVVRDGGFRFT